MATMTPALVLGLAAGFTGGVWAAGSLDTTPYGEIDLNTASRRALQQGTSQGWQEAQQASVEATTRLKEASAERVNQIEAKFEAKLAKADKALKDLQKQSADQKVKLTQVQSSLAETTAALNNARQSGGGPTQGQAVEGTLKSTWVLGRKSQPWPKDCAKPLEVYQIRVTAGAGATVATARLVDAEATRRERKGVLTLTCSMTYSATLPTPLGDAYQFAVSNAVAPNNTLDTHKASAGDLGDGNAPALNVSR